MKSIGFTALTKKRKTLKTSIAKKKDNITKTQLQERVIELERNLQTREKYMIGNTFECNEAKI